MKRNEQIDNKQNKEVQGRERFNLGAGKDALGM